MFMSSRIIERSGFHWYNQWEQLQKELEQAFDPATIKHEGHVEG